MKDLKETLVIVASGKADTKTKTVSAPKKNGDSSGCPYLKAQAAKKAPPCDTKAACTPLDNLRAWKRRRRSATRPTNSASTATSKAPRHCTTG